MRNEIKRCVLFYVGFLFVWCVNRLCCVGNLMREPNPNEQELKQYCWNNIKEITLKGGMELYNALMLDIDRNVITELEQLEKRLLKK